MSGRAQHNAVPLIFTPEVMSHIDPPRRSSAGLLEKWARAKGEAGARVRHQLERCAQLVPEPQRARVLGPICSTASTDEQVSDAVGVLILAAALRSTGWLVDYEPMVGHLTPDLRIRKAEREYLVEVRRITGLLSNPERQAAIARIKDAVAKLPPTRTPIAIEDIHVDGAASLKQFVAQLRARLALREPGPFTIGYEGVCVSMRLHGPFKCDMPIVVAEHVDGIWGDEVDLVRAAIDEKLDRYKVPLIVALDLARTVDGFGAVRDALFGTPALQVSVNFTDSASPDAVAARLDDAVTAGRRHSARVARERLIAVMPFEWGYSRTGDGLEITTELLPNPATRPAYAFAEFDPIPRLVSVHRDNGQFELRQLCGPESRAWEFRAPRRWSFSP